MTYSASLLDPDDEVELTLVADVAGVGRTNKLATGQIVEWDAASLRKFAPSMIGMPVNFAPSPDGEATGHSRSVVGAVTEAHFDEGKQVVTVRASLWRHYLWAVDKIKELWQAGRLSISMEHSGKALATHPDGSVTPSQGRFSGLGLVRHGADPRARVLLLASADDRVDSDAWVTRLVAADLEQLGTDAAERYNASLPAPPSDPHHGHPRARRNGMVICLSCR